MVICRIPLDKNSFSFETTSGPIGFDFAWNTIHGTPGEDGKLQGYFDMMGIPYSSSNHLSSALTFNKYTCKSFLKQHQHPHPGSKPGQKEDGN